MKRVSITITGNIGYLEGTGDNHVLFYNPDGSWDPIEEEFEVDCDEEEWKTWKRTKRSTSKLRERIRNKKKKQIYKHGEDKKKDRWFRYLAKANKTD